MQNYLLSQFDLHQQLYNNVLDGFSDEESNRRPYADKNVNHVKYLAGHLLNSQYALPLIAGLESNVKWNDFFAPMGQSVARDDVPYPTIEEIKKEWNNLYEPTRNGLMDLSNKDLKSSPPDPFNEFADSKGEFWAFINHHQAYHIGQISIIRKVFGKKPMSYE